MTVMGKMMMIEPIKQKIWGYPLWDKSKSLTSEELIETYEKTASFHCQMRSPQGIQSISGETCSLQPWRWSTSEFRKLMLRLYPSQYICQRGCRILPCSECVKCAMLGVDQRPGWGTQSGTLMTFDLATFEQNPGIEKALWMEDMTWRWIKLKPVNY